MPRGWMTGEMGEQVDGRTVERKAEWMGHGWMDGQTELSRVSPGVVEAFRTSIYSIVQKSPSSLLRISPKCLLSPADDPVHHTDKTLLGRLN